MDDQDLLNGCYTELAPPQVLDDSWVELNFDIAPGHDLLRDLVSPETGGGFVYRDTDIVGSATHNRFIYWRTINDILELIEISTEVELEHNQIRIKFANSPVVHDISVIELFDSVVLMIATATSVHRLHLAHPKTTTNSIFNELTSEVLFSTANYYILTTNNSHSNQQPICAASWHESTTMKCALSFPDSSILIVQFSKTTHHITTQEIKQIGIMGRLWSKIPNLITRSQNDCDNAVFVSYPHPQPSINDVLLITLCRDFKIRIFSTNSRECLYTHNTISQTSFSQSFANHTNLITDIPTIRVSGDHIVLYLTENKSEFILLKYNYENGHHSLIQKACIQTPNWEKLVTFSITKNKIWALVNIREAEHSLCYTDLSRALSEEYGEESYAEEFIWDFVQLADDYELGNVRNFVPEIFWRNRFSASTVQKALAGIARPTVPQHNNMESLEQLAFEKIVDENQEEAWARFYNYCVQNHQVSNKILSFLASENEDVLAIVKRSNPSFICPRLMSIELALFDGPYRGIEFSSEIKNIIGPLNHINHDILTDEWKHCFERQLFECPTNILSIVEELTNTIISSKDLSATKLNIKQRNYIFNGISCLCEQLDLTNSSLDYGTKILSEMNSRLKSDTHPLASNCGITLILDLFKELVRARMILARDILIYIYLIRSFIGSNNKQIVNENDLENLCNDLFMSGKVASVANSLRSYAVLVWITETPLKGDMPDNNSKFIDFVASYFKFYKKSASATKKFRNTSLELAIRKNLLTNFLSNGGISFASSMSEITQKRQTISNSFYITNVALNLCRLLWPRANHLCFAEYLFTHNLDEHLAKYDELTIGWADDDIINDHLFIKASNCILQNRPLNAVEIFEKLWPCINSSNLVSRFTGIKNEDLERNTSDSGVDEILNHNVIHKYYNRLIQMFQIINNLPCLVMLINQCMSLLDDANNVDHQQWTNCLRAKLFQYHLELDEIEEAYHTMVLTTDPALRTNCLRKFIVSLCEQQQWSSLISYPFIDIKDDFIDILVQKADSSDLSKLTDENFYNTSYYDLLFSFHISYDEYEKAAHIMYHYSQRLAQEVPGIVSIRKQVDCLLVALNALRCEPEGEAFIEYGAKTEGRSSVIKRPYDCESEKGVDDERSSVQYIGCDEILLKYELIRTRLKLLEKDQNANAIALSPLQPEETISQLVASSMFPDAMDLAVLFKTPMENILEGLTSKFIFISRLSPINITIHPDLEKDLSDIFTSTYGTIDTYNYVANSTSSFVDRLWRLIDYYLANYDGIGHRYDNEDFAKSFGHTTILMRAVASKLLHSGHDIPASLVRMYRGRNVSELLKLLIKYDKLNAAAELAIEIMDIILEPGSVFSCTDRHLATQEPTPVYLPTHLIILLMGYLEEDATEKQNLKTASILSDKLEKFRSTYR